MNTYTYDYMQNIREIVVAVVLMLNLPTAENMVYGLKMAID